MTSMQEQRAAIQRPRLTQVAASELESFLKSDDDEELKVTVAGRGGDRTVVVPRSAVEMLAEILEALGRGREPSVVPMAKELSTGEVASLLGVSRQYAVRLLDEGRLPFRRVGNRRRVRLRDAVRYLREDDRRRADRLAEVAQATLT
ncbi:MAG: excisionase family DNA-binding protein [Actinomycetota bacterium]